VWVGYSRPQLNASFQPVRNPRSLFCNRGAFDQLAYVLTVVLFALRQQCSVCDHRDQQLPLMVAVDCSRTTLLFAKSLVQDIHRVQKKGATDFFVVTSEAQNLCSKCPPFTRTHAFK